MPAKGPMGKDGNMCPNMCPTMCGTYWDTYYHPCPLVLWQACAYRALGSHSSQSLLSKLRRLDHMGWGQRLGNLGQRPQWQGRSRLQRSSCFKF